MAPTADKTFSPRHSSTRLVSSLSYVVTSSRVHEVLHFGTVSRLCTCSGKVSVYAGISAFALRYADSFIEVPCLLQVRQSSAYQPQTHGD